MDRFPQPRVPSGFMSRMPSRMPTNMRPYILIFVAFIGHVSALFVGVASFRNASFFNSNNESKLGILYIIMGIMCMIIVLIEAFGIFSIYKRRAPLVRIFFWLSILATLLILATYIIQVVVHYKFRNDIINICINANEGDHIFFSGFLGPVDGGIVTPSEARLWCNNSYRRSSTSLILSLLLVTAAAFTFAIFVYFYSRQLSNETSSARSAFAMGTYSQNNQPYHSSQAHNNERSDETLHVPGEAFDKFDKPPNYEGEGLVDHKLKDYDLK